MSLLASTLSAEASISRRIQVVQAGIAAAGVAAVVLTRPRSITYLTGFNVVIYSRPQFLVVGAVGTPILIVPHMRAARARSVARGVDVVVFNDADRQAEERDPVLKLRAILHGVTGGTGSVGVEADFMPVTLFRRLEQGLAPHELTDASDLVRAARMVKDAWEIGNIRKASLLAELGMAAAVSTILSGGSEIDANVAAEDRMRREWAVRFPTDDITGFGDEEDGVISALWCWTRAGQHIALSLPASTHDPIPDDAPVLIIIWTTINGYAAEFERTVFKRRGTNEASRAYDAMMATREEVRPLLQAGAVCEDLVEAARDAMRRSGCEIGAGFLGHGLGLGHHERPHLVPGTKTRLAEGMVLAFEPAIFRPDYGVTQSDVVVVGAGSTETVTDWTSFLA